MKIRICSSFRLINGNMTNEIEKLLKRGEIELEMKYDRKISEKISIVEINVSLSLLFYGSISIVINDNSNSILTQLYT